VIRFARSIAREAGDLLLDFHRSRSETSVSYKGPKDMVTAADSKAQELLIRRIREAYPEDGIVAEEEGGTIEGGAGVWHVDPLDGTTNFLHRFPLFAVSVARTIHGELQLGVVHVPVLERTYSAEAGRGCTCNGERIRVSDVRDPLRSLVATGFACVRSNLPEDGVPYFESVVRRVQGIRRGGSAAIDLAFTAEGRLDGFWEMNLNGWDVLAGILLVREAGGVVTDFLGGGAMVSRKEIVAGNRSIHAFLLERIQKTARRLGRKLEPEG